MIEKNSEFPDVNNRHIYSAIYASLLYLNPLYCLEIGTFHGQSAQVFQRYFDKHRPDGKLITIDIKKYVDLSHLSNVTQLIVHPHVTNSSSLHYVIDSELLPYVEDSIQQNLQIIHQAFPKQFDFCFLDGDHQYTSAQRDMQIATSVLTSPKYILFDDIKSPPHECDQVYEELKQSGQWNTYEFENWNCWIGAALIWQK